MGRRLDYENARRRELGFEQEKRSFNAVRDCIEQKINPLDQEMAKVARQLRSRFANESPKASDAEIDARVVTVLAAWSAPTGEKKPPKLEIPKAVLAERRGTRRAEVRKRAQYRRGNR